MKTANAMKIFRMVPFNFSFTHKKSTLGPAGVVQQGFFAQTSEP